MKTSVETAAPGPLESKRAAGTVPTHRNVERLLTGPIGATFWRLAAPTNAVREVTGREPEDFETIARRVPVSLVREMTA